MMEPSGHSTIVMRLAADGSDAQVNAFLLAVGLSADADPRWRRHLPRLLTVRLATLPDADHLAELAAMGGVERLLSLAPGERLVTAWAGHAQVALPGGVSVGGGAPVVIAGPCSVESEAQVIELARIVRAAGGQALRGGVFKPRTSPYDFGGLGHEGLRMLALAGQQAGLPVVTEALAPNHVDAVAEVADVIQIGSRNMHNFPLLLQAGAHPSGRPILLKRGFGATLEEFLLAAEHVLLGRFLTDRQGGVILCERGIRTFEDATRFTLDVGAIPVLRARCKLPIIVDPSHTAGFGPYVAPLALAAIAAGADGLLLEVHGDPKRAWCDGEQAMPPAEFTELMERVRAVAAIVRGGH